MVSLAARNSMDEYTDEEIIIDDFRADSMQFNELLIITRPLSQRTSTKLDIIETSLFSIV